MQTSAAAPGASVPIGQPQDLCRSVGQTADHFGHIQYLFLDQSQAQRQQGIQSRDAGFRGRERADLCIRFMRLMGGADGRKCAALQGIPQLLSVLDSAQWRYQVALAVEFADIDLGEKQIGDGNISGHRCAVEVRACDHLGGPATGQMAEVCTYTDLFDQCKIARHGRGLRSFGDTGETQARRHPAFVCTAIIGQPVVIGKEEDSQIEGCGILERTPLYQ